MTSTIKQVEPLIGQGCALIGEAFNDPDEIHAFEYGIMAGWNSLDPNEKFDTNNIPDHCPEDVKAAILREYHYYTAGWTIGRTVSNRYVQVGGIGVIIVYLAQRLGLF